MEVELLFLDGKNFRTIEDAVDWMLQYYAETQYPCHRFYINEIFAQWVMSPHSDARCTSIDLFKDFLFLNGDFPSFKWWKNGLYERWRQAYEGEERFMIK